MENTWEYPTFEEEEQFPLKTHRKQQNVKSFARCYCNFVECNQTHRFPQENKFEETSSSSSSSSSSESEEEFDFTMKPFKTTRRQDMQQLTEGRKWFTVVELEGLRPQEVTAELNLKSRILLLKLKNVQQQMETTSFGAENKLVRVVPLPTNILFEKLQVQVVLRANVLIITAPFVRYGGEQTWQHQQQGRSLPTWIPIRVTIKNNVNMDAIRAATHRYQPLKTKDFPTNWISYDRFKRYWKQRTFTNSGMEDTFSCSTTGKRFPGFYQPEFFTESRYNKCHNKMNISGIHSTGVLPMTEVIYDEAINKPVMLLKVNVVGFRTEEVRVRVEETQRLLIVEAVKKTNTGVEHGQQLEQEMEHNLTTKYLRREFFLPRFLDVEHIDFRVVKSGILVVKLPIVKQHMKNLNCFTCRAPECGCDELKKDLQQLNINDWEKPLRA